LQTSIMRKTGLLALVSAAALLAACGSTTRLDQPAALSTPTSGSAGATTAGAAPGTAGASASGTPQSRVTTVDLAGGGAAGTAAAAAAARAAAAAGRVVYFDFDSFAIADSFSPLIDVHAKALAANRAKRMVIEGHTDERGGREYNLALGQKRAEAVVRSLALLGADEKQLEAVSFGKERPAVEGSDEAAWAKNRRAELKDR
jgi:peptidoglycan-associated lipoprotein